MDRLKCLSVAGTLAAAMCAVAAGPASAAKGADSASILGKWRGVISGAAGSGIVAQRYTLWIRRTTGPHAGKSHSPDCRGRLAGRGSSGGWTRFVDHNIPGKYACSDGDRIAVRRVGAALEVQLQLTDGGHAQAVLRYVGPV